jgi:hypothetical protein
MQRDVVIFSCNAEVLAVAVRLCVQCGLCPFTAWLFGHSARRALFKGSPAGAAYDQPDSSKY